MKKPLVIALFLNLIGCSLPNLRSSDYRHPAMISCVSQSKIAPLFTVIENSENEIKVELGDFVKYFALRSDDFAYEISFKGITDKIVLAADDVPQIVKNGTATTGDQITITVNGTGAYIFKLFAKSGQKPFWTQKVFAIASKDKKLSDSEKESLAAQYAPILSINNQELYYPVSLEYLTNQVDKDDKLDQEMFRLTNKSVTQSLLGSFFGAKTNSLDVQFPFKELLNVLPFYGHHESVLKSALSKSSDTLLKKRFGKDHAAVYYSVFENVKWNEILINYHFFYSYDPKNGTADKEALPSHIFDRESMTVVLRGTSKQPLYVFYGAHLPTQTMAQLGPDNRPLQSWLTGRTFVNWSDKMDPKKEVIKFESHPIPALALGSHGVYPKPGRYAVLFGQLKALVEDAGGDRYLYPATVTNFTKPNSQAYKLKNLKLENTASGCSPENLLAYSGSTVDVLGPVNATFPPYTDREENFMSYADPNAPLFDMTK